MLRERLAAREGPVCGGLDARDGALHHRAVARRPRGHGAQRCTHGRPRAGSATGETATSAARTGCSRSGTSGNGTKCCTTPASAPACRAASTSTRTATQRICGDAPTRSSLCAPRARRAGQSSRATAASDARMFRAPSGHRLGQSFIDASPRRGRRTTRRPTPSERLLRAARLCCPKRRTPRSWTS